MNNRWHYAAAGQCVLLLLLSLVLGACGNDSGAVSERQNAGSSGTAGYTRENYETGIRSINVDGASYFDNLAAEKTASASAEEDSTAAGADKAVDQDPSTMWMAGNESNQLVIDFGQQASFSYLRILWGSINITSYTLDASDDGENYYSFYTSDVPPYLEEDRIDLSSYRTENADSSSETFIQTSPDGHVSVELSSDGRVKCRYLRLSVAGAALIRELEVYDHNPWTDVVRTLSASILERTDGSSEDGEYMLMLDGLPEGISAEFGGCNYEQIIDETREIHPPLEPKTVSVGYRLSYRDWTIQSPDLPVRVPSEGESAGQVPEKGSSDENIDKDDSAAQVRNAKPEITPAIQEWHGETGFLTLTDETRQLIGNSDADKQPGAEELQNQIFAAASADGKSFQKGQIDTVIDTETGTVEGASGSSEEYEIVIDSEGIHISASGNSDSCPGLIWAWRTLQQMAASADLDADGRILLPMGEIRDYPEYSVRGFEIDAARSFVSLDTLYRIADQMSRHKMNELTVHLNDNEILSSVSADSAEEMLEKGYAAYRMDSDIGRTADTGTDAGSSQAAAAGDNTLTVTADDGSYTQDEFAEFVSYAASIGVTVIPEIDTPAHCLAFTKVFPDLAQTYSPEAVQYLDLSNEKALTLTESLWSEQLGSAFRDCGTVHLGGDEYYGNAREYVNYENSLISWMKEKGRTPRIWGSLSRIRSAGDTRVGSDNVQMIIWNAWWADPELMQRAGFGLINADSRYTYIVPGSANDYMDMDRFNSSYHVNTFAAEGDTAVVTLPSWSPQILGGQITLWNDYSGSLGIDQQGLLDRAGNAVKTASGRFWADQ